MKHKESFCCYAKTILRRRVHWYNAPTVISVGHRHTGALNNRGKTNICKKHRRYEEIG